MQASYASYVRSMKNITFDKNVNWIKLHTFVDFDKNPKARLSIIVTLIIVRSINLHSIEVRGQNDVRLTLMKLTPGWMILENQERRQISSHER